MLRSTAPLTAYSQLAGAMLVKEWGTGLLADPSYFKNMMMVRLPEGLIPADRVEVVDGKPRYDNSHCYYIGDLLYHKYKVEVCLC